MNSVEELKGTIQETCHKIFTPGALTNIRREFQQRLQHCVNHHGQQFEQDL